MCNFCGDFVCEDLPGHYSKDHKAGVWSNQTFPGTKAYKSVENKQLCLIFRHENNSPIIPYFNNIFQHFQTFHSIHPSKLYMYEKDRGKKKKKEKVQAATVKTNCPTSKTSSKELNLICKLNQTWTRPGPDLT